MDQALRWHLKWCYVLAFVIFCSVLGLNLYADAPFFGDRVDLGLIEHDPVNEASGIAASRKNSGVLWTHNDSGDSACVYALNTQGRHLGIYSIGGASNRDWEDMAIGPGPVDGQQYLYIGDIGDNLAQYDIKYIYRVPEPCVDPNQRPVNTMIAGAERIAFRYPDGRKDAETLMIDPLTRDIYVVSKREKGVRVYRVPYPQATTDTMTLEYMATLGFSQAVGGDISPSGLEILIKTYTAVYHWHRAPGQNLQDVFMTDPSRIQYSMEPQGEAICWKANGMGYYAVSEELLGIPAHLYFYPAMTHCQ